MGDAANGKKLFTRLCLTCHTIDKAGKNKIGPNLYGVMGRTSGALTTFKYSESMKKKNITWNDSTLEQYLENPKKFVPGTKMVFAGMKKAEERRDIIAYLQNLK